jgi:hypothetical protein
VGTKKCTETSRRARLAKGEQFSEAAAIIETLADEKDLTHAYITLCVHAGIAAADVICCVRLGEHATGPGHDEAIPMLRRVDPKLASSLKILIDMKTPAGYSDQPLSIPKRRQAKRAAENLMNAARAIA